MAREIEFFFDVGSSYSYLAATQMAALATRTGVPVRFRPFLLGAVFKATGNEMPARIPAKARWMIADMTLWARHYGIPWRIPSRFPLVTLRPQRALAAAERLVGPAAVPAFALALFGAYWVDDQDVTTDPVIAAAARTAQLPVDAVLAAIDAPETKELLRATTDEAIRRGAFGAPAMFVGETLFWGNDRIGLLEEFLGR
ncbi:MAG: 2-hydroxychromene-2-carboxylate isomerase family protein, glutathione-dependent [Deltaproteobacteria bacterium]|nr:2-hydroxychromene-2-carboxylate isomerase family protein, glutathione-dependent [Deltaproteobacteria bacterium]